MLWKLVFINVILVLGLWGVGIGDFDFVIGDFNRWFSRGSCGFFEGVWVEIDRGYISGSYR